MAYGRNFNSFSGVLIVFNLWTRDASVPTATGTWDDDEAIEDSEWFWFLGLILKMGCF